MRRYVFGRYVLDVPDDHSIYDIHRKDALYDRLYGAIVERVCAEAPRGVVIDVGANIGDTAAMVATYAGNPIVSVEGSEKYLEYLRRNAAFIGPQVTVLERFVAADGMRGLSLAYVPREGTGYLALAETAAATVRPDSFIDVPGLIAACRPRGDGVALFKSDTDGCDGFIVAEALDLLDCPFFFECDTNDILAGVPSPWPDTFTRLDKRGYRIVVFDNAGLPMCVSPDRAGTLLRDLSGWITMQRAAGLTKIYYLDVWAFPPDHTDLFAEVSENLRLRFLRPYGF